MSIEEALEWLRGQRSTVNIIPESPYETWGIRIAQADSARTQQAYWVVRAWKENLIPPKENNHD